NTVSTVKKSQATMAWGLGGKELLPSWTSTTGCRIDARVAQDLPHGTRGDAMAQPDEFALHPAVAPGWVLGRQRQYQGTNARGDRWTAGPGMREGPLAVDQLPVPAQQRRR